MKRLAKNSRKREANRDLTAASHLASVQAYQTGMFLSAVWAVPKQTRLTLDDLLDLIVFNGILIGTFMPAVQTAREAARRAAFADNKRQIGLSLHNYDTPLSYSPPVARARRVGLSGFGVSVYRTGKLVR